MGALTLFVLLAAVGSVYFIWGGAAESKARWYAPFVVATGALFLVAMVQTDAPDDVMTVAVPGVLFAVVMQLRTTRFCRSCGRTNRPAFGFSTPRFCHDCGAEL